MKQQIWYIILSLSLIGILGLLAQTSSEHIHDEKILNYTVDPKSQDLQLYWKDDSNRIFKSIENLKTWLAIHHSTLVFAMNAGMYKKDHTPQGLFIQDHLCLSPLDTATKGYGNFYLEPNGIFYLTSDFKAVVCKTDHFPKTKNIRFATQSGPMLVIDGNLHSAFKKDSKNLNIRNGVGILPGGKVIFAMSKGPINFYDFASYFKNWGCINALYLDGFVSRTYLPEKQWIQTDGSFGVIIGVVEK
jgi:uncharacterized protein YigE (DUF2233 family)